MIHIPVVQKEVIEYLDPKPNENFIDATFGLGGHAEEILKRNGPEGKVLAIETDPEILKCLNWKIKHQERLVLVNDSYVNLEEIVKKYNFKPIQGILFDLGMSSWHLEESGRGFSFQKDELLDMRYNKEIKNRAPHQRSEGEEENKILFAHEKLKIKNLTAEKIVNTWSEKEIEKILREYGEERFTRRIAKKIVEERKKNLIKTTFQLVEVIKKAVPKRYYRKLHPARRTFQALRIAVNDELENLKKVLPQALEVLADNGKIVVISFHSLEDRIVKNFFKENSKKGLKILTKKPIGPSVREVQKNPRSSGAKLRAAIKL